MRQRKITTLHVHLIFETGDEIAKGVERVCQRGTSDGSEFYFSASPAHRTKQIDPESGIALIVLSGQAA